MLVGKRSNFDCFVIRGIGELEGDSLQHWRGKALIFAHCLKCPSEKLSVLGRVMFCVLLL